MDRAPVRVEQPTQEQQSAPVDQVEHEVPAESAQEAQVLHVFAYVGVEGSNAEKKLPVLQQENEARSFVAVSGDVEADWRKSFRLQAGERRGWWSYGHEPARRAGIALVHGAVCDHRVAILLDSGSSVSIVGLELARRLKLSMSFKDKLKVKGIGDATSYVTAKAKVKITLGMSVVYYTEVWCGNIGEGIDCLLGMDFMVSAGVRLSMQEGTVRLPDEERVPLVSAGRRPKLPVKASVYVQDDLYVAPGMTAEVPVIYKKDDPALVPWLCRGDHWLTTLVHDPEGRPCKIRVVNVSKQTVCLPARGAVGHLVEAGHLPDDERCVRYGSNRYDEWQKLVYEGSHSRAFAKQRVRSDQEYNAQLPVPVTKPEYTTPTRILTRSRKLAKSEVSVDDGSRIPVPSAALNDAAGVSVPSTQIPSVSEPVSAAEVQHVAGPSTSSSEGKPDSPASSNSETTLVLRAEGSDDPVASPESKVPVSVAIVSSVEGIAVKSESNAMPSALEPPDARNSAGLSREPVRAPVQPASVVPGPVFTMSTGGEVESPGIVMKVRFAHDSRDDCASLFVARDHNASCEAELEASLETKLRLSTCEQSPEQAVEQLANCYRAFVADEEGAADVFYHEGTDFMSLDELKSQLAFLPEFEEPGPCDMSKAEVGEADENTPDEIQELHRRLAKHAPGFMSSGNAAPPPARGVVCDIELEPGTKPVCEKSRPIKGKALPQVYELLKALLGSGIIEYSDSEWASPIVVIMKKNGKDIRLCIDYRRVNRLIKLMRYPLPLIDELLDNFDSVMWLLSLDMASGFWAILMTLRAKHISAFVCPLGHFQWLRMPFGLKNAPLIYQMVIDNCLWGFVRLPPHLEAEVDDEVLEGVGIEPAQKPTLSTSSTPVDNGEMAEEPTVFQRNIPAPACMSSVLGRSSYIDDIAAGTKSWTELCELVDQLLYRIRYWGLSVSLPKSSFGKRSIEFLSHEISRFGVRALPKIVKGIETLEFPASLKGVQSFLGSLNYYHKFIEDFPVIASVLYELTDEQIKAGRDLDRARRAFDLLKERILSPPILRHPDREKPFVVILHSNDWAISAVLAQEHDGQLWPVRFAGRTLQDAELRYHESEKEVLALLRVLTTFYTLVAGHELKVYTRYSVLKWLMTSKSLSDRLLKWATYLAPWTFEVCKIDRDQDQLAALFTAGITPREKLDEIAEELVPNKASRVQLPIVSLEMLDAEYEGYVLSFDGAAKLKTNAGSAGFVLWRLPNWEPVFARGIALTGATVNEAEYHGLLHGLRFACEEREIKDIVIAGDSRIVIQQCLGTIGCKQPHLELLLNEFQKLKSRFDSVRLVHVKREFNGAADYLTGKALRAGESFEIINGAELQQLAELNRLPARIVAPPTEDPVSQVFAVRTRRQAHGAHGEGTERGEQSSPEHAAETRWARIRAHQEADDELGPLLKYLRGELASLSADAARKAGKVADQFEVDSRGVLRYAGGRPSTRPRGDTLRLVVPPAMQADVLHLHHDDVQGGHQGVMRTYERIRAEYYWRGLFKDVEKYVQACVDCVTAKGVASNAGPSPGNVMPEYPMQIVSMDFVIPLPESRQGNTSLLLFQDMFTGFVMCKAMRGTTAQEVAEAYEEVVFRHYGASSEIRHDRDPRFMSEVFVHFTRMMGSRQRATLAYRPQANGQQERSVQTMMRTVRAYVEEPGQEDWEELAGRLTFALNTAWDATRKDTPFHLLHGWDAKTTMAAMLADKPAPGANKLAAYAWRLQNQRQHELAQAQARDLQEEAKRRRSAVRNAAWENLADKYKAGFEVGDAVWLYIAKVKPGLSKKLAHPWHGPFRIVEKSQDFMCKLKIQGTAYRVFPWVHVSRLKPRLLHPLRPADAPVNLPADMDFDAALLPEDSWEPDERAGEYEVEALKDVRWARIRSSKKIKEYLVKWKGYDEPTWEPVSRLRCGQLLYEFDKSARGRARFAAMQVDDGSANVD